MAIRITKIWLLSALVLYCYFLCDGMYRYQYNKAIGMVGDLYTLAVLAVLFSCPQAVLINIFGFMRWDRSNLVRGLLLLIRSIIWIVAGFVIGSTAALIIGKLFYYLGIKFIVVYVQPALIAFFVIVFVYIPLLKEGKRRGQA